MQKNYKTTPENGYTFWLYDPNDLGMMCFRTEAERDLAAEEVISSYIDDDGFFEEEEVRQVSCGIVTHCAQCLDKEMRPNEINIEEEGFSKDGKFWRRFLAWMGRYEMQPISMDFE